MKKTVFFVSFLFILVSSFSFYVPSVNAFNFLDFLFPPVQMQPSTRSPPGPALAPEVPSDDTYSNTLKTNTTTCNDSTVISNSWEPVKKDTGTTDASGNPIIDYVDYDAIDLSSQMDIKNLSNDFYRNFQLFFARGGIKCTEAEAKLDFNNLEADGSGAALRSTPISQILYYRSQFLLEVAKSLDQTNLFDTVAQDYQIAWSCSGNCQELTNETKDCRPVYVSEIIFGLQTEKIYYSTPNANPSTFPSEALALVKNHYATDYSSRSNGKAFSPLSKSIYETMYQQLNFVPKGNADSKVTVTNYDGYNTVAKTKTNPAPTTFNRTLPNAAAATSQEAQVLSYVNPTAQNNLSNASLCDSVQTNSNIATDKPAVGNILLYVKGLFQHVPAGESYSHSESLEVASTYDTQVVSNTQVAEKAYANMIPVSILDKKNLLNQAFSSKTSTNQNNPIPDPGYRADMLYREMQSLLRPSSWF